MSSNRKTKDATPRGVTPAEVCVAYKQTFSTPEGMIVVADLMHRFGFSRTSTFVPGGPEQTFFYEGQRMVLVHVGRMLDADPSEFDQPKAEIEP